MAASVSSSEVGQGSAALGTDGVPPTLAYGLTLEGVDYRLLLERSSPSTTTDYQSYRRRSDGSMVPLGASGPTCSYRGRMERVVANDAALPDDGAGFVSVSVCPDVTGQPVGQAIHGVLRAAGRFWRVWPDAADTQPSDGMDHWVLPVQRKDTPGLVLEAARPSTVFRAPESPAPRLEFREGTPAETKYIELVVVSDAARGAALGGQAEARGIDFVETMNALLEGSGLVPRLRVALRAQVLFDDDPYVPTFAGDEVNHESLLDRFLGWASTEGLPPHDEHLLLSGLDFRGGTVGFAGLDAACTAEQNGFIVEAGDAGGGFAALSAVHELGHTLGMSHDDGTTCAEVGFIMAAVGCGNCPSVDQFSSCSRQQFGEYLAGPAYAQGNRCADDVPGGAGVALCGDAVVQAGESCDCGARDCGDIDPCCDGGTCQLESGAECSDFNDGCCRECRIVGTEAPVVCRARRSACDIEEVCPGQIKDCPSDDFEPAGVTCADERGNAGACYLGDCRSRATQCEQIAEQQGENFANVGAPGPNCAAECGRVICGDGPNGCVIITGPTVANGVLCDGGQCVDQACVSLVDQCPSDPAKSEPGACGCNSLDTDDDADGVPSCVDACPGDTQKAAPGACGCGAPETDTDGDGTADCNDDCPRDGAKQTFGACGCGSSDIDTDEDGVADCNDDCPADAASTIAGACGCGTPSTDTDDDGVADCNDGCPGDRARTSPPCANAALTATARGSASGGCGLGEGTTSSPMRALLLLSFSALAFARRRRASSVRR